MAGKGITYFWRKGWGSAVIILACLGYLLSLSWMKWGDFIIDSGREMYVPLRLISGGLLYRDIFYTYGPFSPYFNALLYMLSGPHLSALVAGGILAALLACFLFFKIARFFLDVFFSTIATLTFLFILAFGHYYNLSNYNFVLPYSYPATHALLFSLMAFYFLFRWLNNVRRCNLWLFGTALFFTLLARIEIGLFVILAALVMKIFSRKQEKYPRFAWKYLCLPLGLALAVYMFFLANSSVLQSNLFDIWRGGMSAHNVFTSHLFGLDRPWENLAIMFKSALYFAVLGIFFASGALLTERLKGGEYKLYLASLIFIIFSSLALILSKGLLDAYWQWQYCSLPLICIFIFFWSLKRLARDSSNAEAQSLLVFSSFSFLLLTRMLFRVWPGHYGFYLMAPGLVVYYVFFFKAVPGLFRTEYAKTFFRWAMLVVLLVLSVRHFALSKYAYSLHTLKISSPRGTLYAFDNQRNRSLKELIEFLSANTAKSDKLVVFPEGVGVNFIADRENPLYYYSYLPIDLTRDEIQRQIIRQIDSEQVEYIALVERDTSEYGSAVFGIDCAKEIAAYIAGNYLAYKFFAGSPFESAGAGTRLFKRKSAL